MEFAEIFLKVIVIAIILFLVLVMIRPMGKLKELDKMRRLLLSGASLLINISLLPLIFTYEKMSILEENLQLITSFLIFITMISEFLLKFKKTAFISFVLSILFCTLLIINYFIIR